MHQTTDVTPEPIKPQSELIDIEYLAVRLSCSTRHVRRLAATGRIPRPIGCLTAMAQE